MYLVVEPIIPVGAAAERLGGVMGAVDCAKWYAFSSDEEHKPANFDSKFSASFPCPRNAASNLQTSEGCVVVVFLELIVKSGENTDI
jgi:hypothetical protein